MASAVSRIFVALLQMHKSKSCKSLEEIEDKLQRCFYFGPPSPHK